MTIQYFENLKKSMKEGGTPTPELTQNIIEELRFFFQMIRVKLETGDASMRNTAASELQELRELLEKHPIILAAVPKI